MMETTWIAVSLFVDIFVEFDKYRIRSKFK